MFMNTIAILIKEQMREPLTLVWNIIMPLVAFLAFNHKSILSGLPLQVEVLSPYVAYAALSLALYSFGVVLIARRETGFFSSMTHTRRSFQLYIMYHMLSIYVIFLATFFCLASAFLLSSGEGKLMELAASLLSGSVGFFCLSLVFLGMLFLPLTIQSAYSFASFVVLGSLSLFWFSTTTENPWALDILSVNPISLIVGLASPGVVNVSVISIYLIVGLAFVFTVKPTPFARRY